MLMPTLAVLAACSGSPEGGVTQEEISTAFQARAKAQAVLIKGRKLFVACAVAPTVGGARKNAEAIALEGAKELKREAANKSRNRFVRWVKSALVRFLPPPRVIDTESKQVPEGAIVCAIAGRPARGEGMSSEATHDYEADQSQSDEDEVEGNTEMNASFPEESEGPPPAPPLPNDPIRLPPQ